MAIICRHCERGDAPILYVAHTSSDGVFQFLCGEDGHEVEDADPIHIAHVLHDDPTISKLLDIEATFEAERKTISDGWIINYDTDLY